MLRGARVQRVDLPAPDLLALGLHFDRTTTTLVVSVSDAAPGIGLVEDRPRGDPAGSVAQLLRKHLLGASLVALRCIARGELHCVFERGDERWVLHVRIARRNSGAVLLDASARAIGGLPRGPRSIDVVPASAPDIDGWPRDLDELRVAGVALVRRRTGEGTRDAQADLRRALLRARARVERRARAIDGDLGATEAAPSLREDASLVLGSLRSIPRGAAEAVLDDPARGEARRITLDPALTPTENANRMFVRARKLDRGAKIAAQRGADALAELARFEAALVALDAGDAAAAIALTTRPTRGARPEPVRRVPYRTFVLDDGTTIRVGRGARDNDVLTWKHAAPVDVFFHARARTGAHVILRVSGGPPSADARHAAAALAAHFSGARDESAVDVDAAERRHIRRGKARGSVILGESSTVRVRLDTYPLAALLARETKP